MDLINEILHWLCLYVLLWYAYILLVNKGVPNIRTAPAIRKKVIEILSEEAAKKGKLPFKIVDLGSGNGDFVRQMAKSIPNARVTGLEIDIIAHLKARFWKKLGNVKNATFIRKSFYDHDLSDADAVTVFHLDSSMPEIREKLTAELKPGTIVTANRFPLGGEYEPTEVIDVSTLAPNQKELYIYRL